MYISIGINQLHIIEAPLKKADNALAAKLAATKATWLALSSTTVFVAFAAPTLSAVALASLIALNLGVLSKATLVVALKALRLKGFAITVFVTFEATPVIFELVFKVSATPLNGMIVLKIQ